MFTPDELRRLAEYDAKVDRYCPQRTGRPRSAPDTPRQEKARQRALARYYRKKESGDV